MGYRLFHHFSGGRNEALIPDWKARRITSREVLTREAEMVRATAGEIMAFLQRMELDPEFPSFVQLARSHGVTPVVLSDGLDLYIFPLLRQAGLDDLPVICNRGVLEDGRLRIEFPHRNRTCGFCGNCKGERIEEFRAREQDATVVFVGDGYSDACAVRRADIVFAKKDLAEYCSRENIAYTVYDTFADVREELARRGFFTMPHR